METRESRGRKRTFEAHGYEEDSQGSRADSRPLRYAERWGTLCSWSKGRLARLADIVETIKVIGLCETFEENVESVDCIFRF